MSSALRPLRDRLADVMDLRRAADLIEWDEQVTMPSGGAAAHGEMLGTLRRLAHETFVADETGDLLARAEEEVAEHDPESETARLVAVTARDHRKAALVPGAFVAEQAQVTSAAQHAWAAARAANDFAAFQPHLEHVLTLKRRYVGYFPAGDHPYDVLLDDFEPETTTAEVRTVFEALRPPHVELIRRIAEQPQVDDGCLHGAYAEADLLAFAVEVVTAFGFDWTRGRQDRSPHPFATAMGADDVRITTRFMDRYPFSLLFGTMHETGHGLYEQGVSPDWHRTPLEGGASLGVHESQSRLWENLVGRSRPFWVRFYPALQARFPDRLGTIDLDAFYRAINRVEPSLIRVEADEATYNLHVMMRVELEIALIEGTLEVADLPAAWNDRMAAYLGIRPPDDTAGVLQDVHWSAGLFGYFATYTLGNLISAQLWERFGQQHADRDDAIARGDFSALLGWLRETVHRHGRRYAPQELVRSATGSPIDPGPYLRYLETKYAGIYNL